jgi:hypothetical protein
MTHPKPLDLDAIEATARAATPGEWRVADWTGDHRVGVEAFHGAGRRPICVTDELADAAHIAAANPATVLALVARIREFEAGLRAACDVADGLEDPSFVGWTALRQLAAGGTVKA